jgi:hypothetical protein
VELSYTSSAGSCMASTHNYFDGAIESPNLASIMTRLSAVACLSLDAKHRTRGGVLASALQRLAGTQGVIIILGVFAS